MAGFWTALAKTTRTARPSIAAVQKLVSSEWNEFTDLFNSNYQAFLDLKTDFENSGTALPYVRKDIDFTISDKGIYLFFGSTPRTFIIDDAIIGVVEIRTIATSELTLSGSINNNHLGMIYPGTSATVLRWDSVALEYTF